VEQRSSGVAQKNSRAAAALLLDYSTGALLLYALLAHEDVCQAFQHDINSITVRLKA
jgi:hypothetical protein